jgi:hypothetical protein
MTPGDEVLPKIDLNAGLHISWNFALTDFQIYLAL